MERDVNAQSDPALQLACRALAHVLDLDPSSLRDDSPLRDIGADSVAVLMFADVVEGFAAQANLAIDIDSSLLRAASTVGQLAESVVFR